jgi:hypothetical protein
VEDSHVTERDRYGVAPSDDGNSPSRRQRVDRPVVENGIQ